MAESFRCQRTQPTAEAPTPLHWDPSTTLFGLSGPRPPLMRRRLRPHRPLLPHPRPTSPRPPPLGRELPVCRSGLHDFDARPRACRLNHACLISTVTCLQRLSVQSVSVQSYRRGPRPRVHPGSQALSDRLPTGHQSVEDRHGDPKSMQ